MIRKPSRVFGLRGVVMLALLSAVQSATSTSRPTLIQTLGARACQTIRLLVVALALGWSLTYVSLVAAQSFTEGFDNVTFPPLGWTVFNKSTVIGINPTCWERVTTSPWAPQAGAGQAYAGSYCTGGINTISGWLIAPQVTLQNGGQITFWTRIDFDNSPDRLQVRLSTNGASTNVGTSATDVGDFSTLLLDINPTLVTGVYPTIYTEYTITLSGLSGLTDGRVAFRYFVTNGGPTGANSEYITIDEFAYVAVPTEIAVSGNSVDIADGDAVPALDDYTDFGAVAMASGTVVRTFTIANSGPNPLLLGSVTVGGTHATDFTVSLAPTSPVAVTGSTTFQVTFDPSEEGVRSATLSFLNNDSNENPFNFSIQGTGDGAEIAVSGNTVTIVDGDTTPHLADHTDFGVVAVDSDTVARTFTITSNGTVKLTLGNVTVGGANAGDFTVTAQPASPVLGSAVSLTNAGFEALGLGAGEFISNPTGVGWTFGGQSGVAHNGSPLFVNLAPQGFQAAFIQNSLGNPTTALSQLIHFPAPGAYVIRFAMVRRNVEYPANDIEVKMDGTTLRTVSNAEQPDDTWRTFTVIYDCLTAGDHTLAFVGTRIGGDYASVIDDVQIENYEGETTFEMTFDPSAPGLRSATLSFSTNDSGENPFNFSIQGTGTNEADLSITKTDGQTTVVPGQTVTYTITASNGGLAAATSATVTDTFPAACGTVSWTCLGSNGGSCTPSGSGNLNDPVVLPNGGSVVYTAPCTVSGSASGSLENTATVTSSNDPDTGNNSATDTDTITCTYALTPLNQMVTASATTGASVTVTTQPGCAWTATNLVPWVTIMGGSPGTGSGAMTYNVAANPGPNPRRGTLTVAGKPFIVSQRTPVPAPCTISASTSAIPVPVGGSTVRSVAIEASTTSCAWSAKSHVAWITLTSAPTGRGDALVAFTVAANNTGQPRKGRITVNGKRVVVAQN
jgi:uncharacterized repeat protein (TIGR01451 family)